MDTEKNNLLKIDQTILNETTKCSNDFECLRNENYVCRTMKVESCIGGTILFMNCKDKLCNYKIYYGNGTICNCPVRKELYNKYKI